MTPQINIDNEKHRAAIHITDNEWKVARIGENYVVGYDDQGVAVWVWLVNMPPDATMADVIGRLAELSVAT